MKELKLEKKNLVIFFPWSKEELDLFRKFKSVNGYKQAEKEMAMSKIIVNVAMVDELLKSMKFEDSMEGQEAVMLSSYFDDEDWEVVRTRQIPLGESEPRNPNWRWAEALKMHCNVNSNCRGWIIDLKNLIFFRMNDDALNYFKGKIKVMKTFDELEKFIENFKFRFAAKKFGI